MTDKQIRFCDEYLVNLNAFQAAIHAGYSVRRAFEISKKLIADKKIRELIKNKMDNLMV